MRLATFERDFWQLRCGEASHRAHPETFWIPPREERDHLRRGQSARLIFDIEGEDEDGQLQVQGERMWVTVAERVDDVYIGILENEPACFEPAQNVYLCRGAEVPFLAEHVIDITDASADYVEWQLGQEPKRRWPRN
jgi:hypothetical protein